MWKNVEQPDRPQMTVWRMRIARWIPKATHAHTEYVIITAFPVPKWLHESSSVLRYKHIACIILNYNGFHACRHRGG